jgi:hypothetical protein
MVSILLLGVVDKKMVKLNHRQRLYGASHRIIEQGFMSPASHLSARPYAKFKGLKMHSSPAAFSNNSDGPGTSWASPRSAESSRKGPDGLRTP